MQFCVKETAKLIVWPFTDVDLLRVYGAPAMLGVGSKDCEDDSRNQHYTLIYNLNPTLPINLTMARIVESGPRSSRRILITWARRPFVAGTILTNGAISFAWNGKKVRFSAIPDSIEEGLTAAGNAFFSVFSAPLFHDDFEFNELSNLGQGSYVLTQLESLREFRFMFSRNHDFTNPQIPPRSISPYIAQGTLAPRVKTNKSSIVSRTFAELDLTYEPLGFERIDLDARALHGEKNLFAARQVCFQSDTPGVLWLFS
ncbi:hypothetical protein R3P38DRAFT_3189180 [Favolaschia claudopus]|uniref:Uncharacterized protein n=1 Tax=Favolaschia claudopus TaxID=2862362 RepID=A0AAW0BU49_9AGAR